MSRQSLPLLAIQNIRISENIIRFIYNDAREMTRAMRAKRTTRSVSIGMSSKRRTRSVSLGTTKFGSSKKLTNPTRSILTEIVQGATTARQRIQTTTIGTTFNTPSSTKSAGTTATSAVTNGKLPKGKYKRKYDDPKLIAQKCKLYYTDQQKDFKDQKYKSSCGRFVRHDDFKPCTLSKRSFTRHYSRFLEDPTNPRTKKK